MKSTVTRREWITRSGCAIGGVLATGAMQACTSGETRATAPESAANLQEIPYAYKLLDPEEVLARGYRNYFKGGCCYGSFSALVEHLAETVGAPFDTFPVGISYFGGGGIAGYGSVCGALLGGAMAFSLTISGQDRNSIITDLFRWYETNAFPTYRPVPGAAVKVDGPLNTSVCNSHLCHASVTKWCTQEGVSPASDEKRERCARLTADVAGRVARMLNDYLVSGTYASAATLDPVSSGCLACHGAAGGEPPANVASGMQCTACHEAH